MSSLKSEEQVLICKFTHIHPLTKVDGTGGFKCNGCKTKGFGKTYRCSSCDYDLHEYCATCPHTLRSSLHPQHELELLFTGPEHVCDICNGLAEGLYYRCDACDFDVHPPCTQKPQNVSHVHVPHQHDECECRNKGQGHASGPKKSKRKIVYRFMRDVTVRVVAHIIAEMDS